MKHSTGSILILFLFFILILAGCSSSHWLTQPGYMVIKNKNLTDNKKVPAGDLASYVQLQPNKDFLGLFHMAPWIYSKTNQGKSTKFKSWVKRKFGKAPVMLDTRMTDNSVRDMKMYINNIGYYNSKIKCEYLYKKNKVTVKYTVTTGQPYILRNIKWIIPDDTLQKYVMKDMDNSLIKSGEIYNNYTLDSERSRITKDLKDLGYFDFVTDFISYEIDSSLNSHQMDVTAQIQNIRYRSPINPDSIIEQKHKRYIFNNIYINPEFNTLHADSIKPDTIEFKIARKDHSDTLSGYYFINYGKFKTRPKVFSQSVFFKKGDMYHYKDVAETNTQLSRLPVTRLATINLDEKKVDGLKQGEDFGLLDCRINIARSPVNSFSVETDVTNSAGNPGLAGSFSFQNKNIFRGAEVFRIKLRASAEVQQSSSGDINQLGIFNTFETSIEFSLQFPRFLIPISQERFSKYFRPKTSIITSYTYEVWPTYARNIANISFGYNWQPVIRKRHSFFPLEISSVKINIFDSTFYNDLYQTKDIWLIEQYTDHAIVDLRYNYIYTSQQIKKPIDFIYIDASAETGGNLLNAITSLSGSKKNAQGKYTVAGIPFAQYFKSNLDLRYYHYLNQDNILVLRGYLGLGMPYGNSEALPFERAFFGGGANDQRGWEYMRLGPGSFQSDTLNNIDRSGDIKLMGNIEFRFPVYKFFHGGLFVDAGNIWQINESESFPGGQFKFNQFLSQIAIDAGIGVRFDFDFFIFRLDAASPICDPSRNTGEEWIFTNGSVGNLMWNFAIGYPF